MLRQTRLTDEEIREIIDIALEEFKADLIEELRNELQLSSNENSSNDPLISTVEVCRRWGRSRTTISKLIKSNKLAPAGKYKHSFTFRMSDVVRLFGDAVC